MREDIGHERANLRGVRVTPASARSEAAALHGADSSADIEQAIIAGDSPPGSSGVSCAGRVAGYGAHLGHIMVRRRRKPLKNNALALASFPILSLICFFCSSVSSIRTALFFSCFSIEPSWKTHLPSALEPRPWPPDNSGLLTFDSVADLSKLA